MLQRTNLGDADANLLKEAADSLEKRIAGGESSVTESVIKAYSGLARNRENVLELMYLEWVLRCERDELPIAEEFFVRFPEFAADFEKLVRVDEVVRGAIPESGVTLAEKAAIDFDALAIQSREVLTNRPSPAHSITIGGYTLERIIGRGGMGIVYQARQHQLDRLVALKTIDFAGSLNPRTVARFRTEAELVARLQHPNIVQVYETGSHSGMPFFSMELVDGGTLATAISSASMKPHHAAKLVEVLSRAIHYAHSQGIIHRDLKPANVLLARSDRAEALDLTSGSCEASGPVRYEPKIVDFGLAKLLGDTSRRTMTGAMLGTPSYMSPEQLSSEYGEIGPATDVYSLGAILYELLVGQPPFHAATAIETMQQVRNEEPSLPPSLRRKLPRDLLLICMTCLRKEPERRYASAADLANDLQRYLSGNPIQARPANLIETTVKWTKRHPSAAALLASITLATIGMTLLWWRAEQSSNAEHAERVRAENMIYARNIALAQFEFRSNNVEACRRLLASCELPLRNWEWQYLDSLCDDAVWESPLASKVSVYADISDDGRYVASYPRDKWGHDGHEPITVWDIQTGEKKWTLSGHPGSTYCVEFSPDGKSLASTGVVWNLKDQTGGAKVWNLEDGTEKFTLVNKNAHVVRFRPDGKTIFVGLSSGTIVEFDSDTGNQITQYRQGVNFISDITFHSSGKLMAASSRDHRVVVWDIENRKPVTFLSDLVDPRTLAWQPGTNVLAVGCYGGQLKKFELVDGQLKPLDVKGYNAVPLIAYSPDGHYFATSVFGDATQIVEVHSGRTVRMLRGHNGHVDSMSFDESGKRLVTAGVDGSVKVWDLNDSEILAAQGFFSRDRITAMAANPTKLEIAFAFTHDGRDGAAADPQNKIRLAAINLVTKRVRRLLTGESNWITSVAYSPDGKTVLAGNSDQSINHCDSGTGKILKTLSGHKSTIVDVAFVDSKLALSIDEAGEAKIWNLESGDIETSFRSQPARVVALCVDPHASRAIVVGVDGSISVWQLPTGKLVHRRKTSLAPSVAKISQDGTAFAVADVTGKIELWQTSKLIDARSVSPQFQLCCHADRITSLSFSPDGKRLVTGSSDESIKLVDVENGCELVELDRIKGRSPVVMFSADGKHILSGEIGRLSSWSIKPQRLLESTRDEKVRSAMIEWHSKQMTIAAVSESAFAFDFHYNRLLTLAPTDLEGSQSELIEAMDQESRFIYLQTLARAQLGQGSKSDFQATCQLLYKESLLALKRDKNYKMAWTCCLSPDSGVNSSIVLTMLDATRLVNSPAASLAENIPLIGSSLSGPLSGDRKKKKIDVADYDDGVYALACYRAGKFELAAKHARAALKSDSTGYHVHALTLAMSLARKDDLVVARKTLASAKARRDKPTPGNVSPKLAKYNSLEYPLLLAEAEIVLARAEEAHRE